MSQQQTIIAIDPSLTGTAVVIGNHPHRYHHRRFPSENQGRDIRSRVARVEDLVARIIKFCRCAEDISHVLIEDYAFGANDSGARYVAEFRGLLNFYLSKLDGEPIIVEPNVQQLKKFVTGKANTKKEFMRVEAYKRWGVEFDSNDEVDAYGLYRIGLCLNGYDTPEINAQRDVVEKLTKKIEEAGLLQFGG